MTFCNAESTSRSLEPCPVATFTFKCDKKRFLQSTWYIASAAWRSLTAPSTRILTCSAQSSFLALHVSKIVSLVVAVLSLAWIARNGYAGLQRDGFFLSFSRLHFSPQNKQCYVKRNSVLLSTNESCHVFGGMYDDVVLVRLRLWCRVTSWLDV